MSDIASPTKINSKLNEYSLISVVGKGTYAKVVLVKHKKSQEIFAMKILKKKYLEQKKQVLHTKGERDILVESEHPFIIRLFYSF